MNDSSGLPFETKLMIVRAERSGLVGYADGSESPTMAWSTEGHFIAWAAAACRAPARADDAPEISEEPTRMPSVVRNMEPATIVEKRGMWGKK